jgi:hypothetical protein
MTVEVTASTSIARSPRSSVLAIDIAGASASSIDTPWQSPTVRAKASTSW